MELSLIHAVNTGKMTLEEAKKAEADAAAEAGKTKAAKKAETPAK